MAAPLSHRPGAHHPGIRAMLQVGVAARARVAGGLGPRGRQPVIVKAIGRVLQGPSIRTVAAYIGRLDRDGAVDVEDGRLAAQYALTQRDGAAGQLYGRMRDEAGSEIPRSAICDVLAGWRAQGLEARHLVMSVPGDADDLQMAVGATVRDTVLAWGVPAIWAIHTDHAEHPHAHVLLAARLRDGRMLPFAPDGLLLDGFRAALANNARGLGLDVSSERESDRRGGRDGARDEVLVTVTSGRTGGRSVEHVEDALVERLRRSAPRWWSRWGDHALAGLNSPGESTVVEALGGAAELLSRSEMALEAPKLEKWLSRHVPHIFRGFAREADGDQAALRLQRRRARAERKALHEREVLARAVEGWAVAVEGASPSELAARLRAPDTHDPAPGQRERMR